MPRAEDQVLPVLNPVTDYEKIKRVGEGTYGVVCRRHVGNTYLRYTTGKVLKCLLCVTDKARDRQTGEYVALKKLRMDRERDGEGFLAVFSIMSTCLQFWQPPETKIVYVTCVRNQVYVTHF